MRKVLVIGSGGAGKSTFARRLGEVLGLEVIHLDTLYWNPDWIETPRDVWRERVAKLVEREAWIIDGNYSNTFDIRVEACDTLIFLDTARTVCLWRIIKRAFMYRNTNRPDMAEGCPERLSLEFVLWVWNYPTRTRPRVLELMKTNAERKMIVRLRSQSEIESFLASARDI
ncbi:MAG TPA: DNA topology modulation protein [Pyrinomonadaceae bacterium]|jgi:adenylate kinase family enzyme